MQSVYDPALKARSPLLKLWLTLLALSTASAYSAQTNSYFQAPGTRRMAERLQEWGRQVGDQNPYANVALLKSLQEQLAKTTDAGQRLDLQYQLAEQFLNVPPPDDCL